ncbi:MAG: glycosyltransferase [Candidatus Cloacimonas sp.]|jgi:glycosyltransferase involved in cell wall biosynthesis|nr:glycosyltransferase [Candidatus Cloacimonas sp.]
MKKILHIQLLPLLSGVQRFSLHLLAGLDRQEFEIWVASKPGGEFVDEVKAQGYHYLPLPTFCHHISLLDFLTFLHLLWLMHKERFDIVHTNSSKPGLLGRLAARLCHVPLIVHTVHGTPFRNGQHFLTYGFYAALEYLGNKLGHITVFVNNSDRINCQKMELLPKSKAKTIFNAIPLALQSELAEIAKQRQMPEICRIGILHYDSEECRNGILHYDSEECRNGIRHYGSEECRNGILHYDSEGCRIGILHYGSEDCRNGILPYRDIVIGTTVRFSTQKNVIRLVATACRACRKAPNLKFIILGDGEHYAVCQAIVRSNNLGDRVLLPGWDKDIVPWLKVFNAFVLYSRWEAQPFSIIEAMSSGLPLICSAIPSIKELTAENTAYLVALDDDTALEEVFVQIATNFQPAFAKGKQAAEQINELCSYQHMVQAYREIYLGR